MGIRDADLTVWDGVTLATSGDTESDAVDFGSALPDVAKGYPVTFSIRQTGAAGVGTGTYTFKIVADTADDLVTAPVVIQQSDTIVATSTGIIFQGTIATGVNQANLRYLGIVATAAGTISTGMTVDAAFVQAAESYESHPAGVTTIFP